jgi:hypothetical protein
MADGKKIAQAAPGRKAGRPGQNGSRAPAGELIFHVDPPA